MKKFLAIMFGVMFAVGVVAAPPRHGGHGGHGGRGNCGPRWRPCPPPPPPHHHHHGGGNSGVRLATDIVNLVGAGLNVLRPPTTIVTTPGGVITTTYPGTVVTPAPTVQTVIVGYDAYGRPIYSQQVVPAPVVTTPVVTPQPTVIYR